MRAALDDAERVEALHDRIGLLEEIFTRSPPTTTQRVLSKTVVSAIEAGFVGAPLLDRLVPLLSQDSLMSLPDRFEDNIGKRLECYLELARRVGSGPEVCALARGFAHTSESVGPFSQILVAEPACGMATP